MYNEGERCKKSDITLFYFIGSGGGVVCRENAAEFMRSSAVLRNGLSVVPFASCREAARRCGISAREAEVAALRAGLCPSRYERGVAAIGLEGQAMLLESCAAVAGCGGLGGWIVEILARAGVGKLILVDGDVFGENNLNRQLYATEGNLGEPKAEAAARRVRAVNSAVETDVRTVFLDVENCAEIFAGADVVMDALDNNGARQAALDCCRTLGIPFVHGAVSGFCGETAVLRAGDAAPWELCGAPDRGAEAEEGTTSFIPPFIAAAQAAAAIKILARAGETPQKTMLWFDLARCSMQRLKLR